MKTDIQSTTGGHWEVTCVIAMPPARTISLGQSNHVCMQAHVCARNQAHVCARNLSLALCLQKKARNVCMVVGSNLWYRFLGAALFHHHVDSRNQDPQDIKDHLDILHTRQRDTVNKEDCLSIVNVFGDSLSVFPAHERLRSFRSCVWQQLLHIVDDKNASAEADAEGAQGDHIRRIASAAVNMSLWHERRQHTRDTQRAMTIDEQHARMLLHVMDMLCSMLALDGAAYKAASVCAALEASAVVRHLAVAVIALSAPSYRASPEGTRQAEGGEASAHHPECGPKTWWRCLLTVRAEEAQVWGGGMQEGPLGGEVRWGKEVWLERVYAVAAGQHHGVVTFLLENAREAVENGYQWLLGRDPDTEGLESKMEYMRVHGGGYVEMRAVLMASEEYRRRCGSDGCERTQTEVRRAFMYTLLREPDLQVPESNPKPQTSRSLNQTLNPKPPGP
jgi:hypothetical protein